MRGGVGDPGNDAGPLPSGHRIGKIGLGKLAYGQYSMKGVVAVCLCIPLLSIPCNARAAPSVEVTVKYYDIRGASTAALRLQMKRLGGIRSKDGNTYYANTSSHVTWRVTYGKRGSRCSISSVQTSVDISYRLPRWSNRRWASAALKRRWEIFVRALKKHEQGHGKIAVDSANEIEQSIAKLRPRRTCDTLGKAADALAHQILGKYGRIAVDYDRRTRHGATQGAKFQ